MKMIRIILALLKKLPNKWSCIENRNACTTMMPMSTYAALLFFLLSGISDHKSYSYMCIHLDLRVSSINDLVLNISRTDRCYTSIVGNVGESNYQSLIHDSTHMYSTISLKDLNEIKPKDRKKCFPCKL